MADKQTIIVSVVVGTSLGVAIIGIGILSAAVIRKLLQRRRESARTLTDSTPLLAEIVTPDESPVPADKISSSHSAIPSPSLPVVASSFVVHREEARSLKKPLSQLPTASNLFEKFPRLEEWYNSRVTPQIASADFFENYCIEFLRDYEVQYNGALIKGATIEGIFFLLATLSPSSEALKDLQEVFFATYTGPSSAKEVVHLFISAYHHFKKSKNAKSNILMSLDYWLTNYFHDLYVDKHKEHSSTQLKEETICILIRFLTTLKQKKDHFLKIVDEKLFAKEQVNTYPVALEWSARLEEIKALTKEQESEEAEEEPASEGDGENEEEEDGENPTLGEPEFPEGWSETADLSSFNFLEWSALEIARQLTILEREYFQQVKLYEFVGDRFSQRWMPKEAPNLNKLTTYFNNLGKWISQMVLQEEDHEQRAKILEHILDVVEQLVVMNNFNSLMAIYAGLTNVAVHRLKKTWASVSEDHNGLFEMLSELLSPSKKFKNLKQALNQISKPPAITYVGLFLGDLVTIDTHSPEFFDQKLLNINKKRVVCKLLKQLQTFQKNCNYEYTKIPYVQNLLHSALDDDTSTLWTDEKAYDESIRLEPIKQN